MTRRINAKYHLKVVCPLCPTWRKKLRDVEIKGECWWNRNWKLGNYCIPRHFGIKNFISEHIFLTTNLKRFKKLR
jgi:hypothetical protein